MAILLADAPPLTKDDVRALREGKSISFRYLDEQSTISATRDDGPWEQRHEIQVNTSYYGDSFSVAYEYITSAQFSPTWQTIAALIRVGDVLALEWHRGGATTESLRNAGYAGDILYLRVTRGERKMTFLVDERVTESHSSSRMTRDR